MSCAWQGDARYATASVDRTVHLFSAEGEGATAVLKVHTGEVNIVACQLGPEPLGASGADDGNVVRHARCVCCGCGGGGDTLGMGTCLLYRRCCVLLLLLPVSQPPPSSLFLSHVRRWCSNVRSCRICIIMVRPHCCDSGPHTTPLLLAAGVCACARLCGQPLGRSCTLCLATRRPCMRCSGHRVCAPSRTCWRRTCPCAAAVFYCCCCYCCCCCSSRAHTHLTHTLGTPEPRPQLKLASCGFCLCVCVGGGGLVDHFCTRSRIPIHAYTPEVMMRTWASSTTLHQLS